MIILNVLLLYNCQSDPGSLSNGYSSRDESLSPADLPILNGSGHTATNGSGNWRDVGRGHSKSAVVPRMSSKLCWKIPTCVYLIDPAYCIILYLLTCWVSG